jgi:hypothetical protein
VKRMQRRMAATARQKNKEKRDLPKVEGPFQTVDKPYFNLLIEVGFVNF